MNLLAATAVRPEAVNQIYNLALNARTDLNELYEMLRGLLVPEYAHLRDYQPCRRDFRAGDVMHSQANIDKAANLLGYVPTHDIVSGLDKALRWYTSNI